MQAVLSGAVAMTFLLNIDDTIFKSLQAGPCILTLARLHESCPVYASYFTHSNEYSKAEVFSCFLQLVV